MVGIAVAALMAAWLPFTVMYVTAVNKRATAAVTTWQNGHPVVTTKTSGGQTIQASTPVTAAKAPAATAVITRAS